MHVCVNVCVCVCVGVLGCWCVCMCVRVCMKCVSCSVSRTCEGRFGLDCSSKKRRSLAVICDRFSEATKAARKIGLPGKAYKVFSTSGPLSTHP